MKEILKLNDWKTIVTHNIDGEYGNEHNKLTNQYVTEIYNELELKSNLYYFGKYYSKNQEILETTNMNEKQLKEKMELINNYEIEKAIEDNFVHMYQYENWNKN